MHVACCRGVASEIYKKLIDSPCNQIVTPSLPLPFSLKRTRTQGIEAVCSVGFFYCYFHNKKIQHAILKSNIQNTNHDKNKQINKHTHNN